MIRCNGIVINVNKFPDGTTLFDKSISNVFNFTPTIYMSRDESFIEWFFENDEETLTLWYLVHHLRSHGVKSIDLYMPYIPNGRMDRVKGDRDVFTLKYFAELINILNFNEVTVLDPHSSVSEALINNIDIISPKDNIEDAITRCNPDMLFFPDEGSMKRYSSMAEMEYAFGIKKRDWQTGRIEGLDVAGSVDKIKDSRILIVDDICSRGGTFYHSAKKLKELGAKEVYLYITHCENTIFEGELLKTDLINKIYTTNSIFTKEHEKIEVFEL